MAALWHAVLCAWLAVGVTSGAVEAEGERWARVGTLAHTHAFEALVAAHHGHDEAAFARAQREELALRAAMGRVQQTAHELQASAVLGADGVDAATWAHVQDRLRTMFGEESVRPHRVGVTLVFAEARDTHKVEEVMQWAEVSAVAPWLAAHKLSPLFKEFREEMCSDTFVHEDGSVVELSVLATPRRLRDVAAFSKSLQDHLDSGDLDVGVRVQHDFDRLPDSAFVGHGAEAYRMRELRVEVDSCANVLATAEHVAEHRHVMWVEPRAIVRISNKWAAGITQAAQVDNNFVWDQGLNGTGQIVGVSDTGLDASHCFFYDPDVPTPYSTTTDAHRKIVTYIPYVNNQDYDGGHGSHVSGSVLGQVYDLGDDYDDVADFNGMAFGAKIAFYDIGNQNGALSLPANINNAVFGVLYNAGARIISNSWGSELPVYDVSAKNSDQFMWDNPAGLLLYAAGNEGDDGASTVGSPSTAKSVVAVGCTLNSVQSWATFSDDTSKNKYNYQNMAYFSSQGPTADGRLKPDVSAPGYYTTSTDANAGVDGSYHCGTLLMAGTSMATPTTAGNTALIREYLMSGYYPTGLADPSNAFEPSGALLKAMLIHSAVAMDALLDEKDNLEPLGDPPDNIQGYGRIEVDNVLMFLDQNNWYSLFLVGSSDSSDDDLYSEFTTTGEQDQYVITTSSDITRELKFTLTWSDYPEFVGLSNGSLVNELSLSVDTDTKSWSVDDDLNPVQQITISNPDPKENYTITVAADVILESPQPYALVVSGNLDNISYVVQPVLEDDWSADDDDDSGLSDGAIAGIVVACLVVAAMAGFGVGFYRNRQRAAQGDSYYAFET